MSQQTPAASSSKPHPARLGLTLLTGVLACQLIWACSREDSPEPQHQPPAQAIVHTYSLRGRIVSLPDPSNPASELRIHHEAIDDFKNAQGQPAPMKAMTMSFPPAPGVSLDGLAVGDIVQFVFRVQWEPTYEMGTTSIRKLPADTQLSFE